MTAAPKRQNAGVAVAGLFARPSATGGLAGRDNDARAPHASDQRPVPRESRVRLGVELTEQEAAFLRVLSRPSQTGGPRTLGAKFVAAGVRAAAIELLERGATDMHGVAAGDHGEMIARACEALLRAGGTEHEKGETR